MLCPIHGSLGKTETTKHLVRHVLSLAHGGTSGLQAKIIQSSPILEVRSPEFNTPKPREKKGGVRKIE